MTLTVEPVDCGECGDTGWTIDDEAQAVRCDHEEAGEG